MLELILLLPPEEALAFFRQKGYRITRHWLDMAPEAHARAFTVARVAALEVLREIRRALDEALQEGRTLRWFREHLIEALQQGGWLPHAEEAGVTLPWRLQTIFRTNLQSAYMAGRYVQQVQWSRQRPYWQYVAVLDERTRPSHRALHGLVFPADDPFWQTHYPPNGYNCRCRVRALTEREVAERGLRVSSGAGRMVREDRVLPTPDGSTRTVAVWGYRADDGRVIWTDPGWSTNPGKLWRPDLDRYIDELKSVYLRHTTPLGRMGERIHTASDIQSLLRDLARHDGEPFADYLTVEFLPAEHAHGIALRELDTRTARIALSTTYQTHERAAAALRALARGEELDSDMFNGLRTLWHEYRHLRQTWLWQPELRNIRRPWYEMEILHEYVTQRTLNDFVSALGGKPIEQLRQRANTESSSGYQDGVRLFRVMLWDLGIDEEQVVPMLEELDRLGPPRMRYEYDFREGLVEKLWQFKGLPLPDHVTRNRDLAADTMEVLNKMYYAAANGYMKTFNEYRAKLATLKEKGALDPKTYARRTRRPPTRK